MFIFHIVKYGIFRNKARSILNLLICILLVSLLEIYLQNIVNNKEQLNELPDALPVFCKIINLNGSQESGLEISEELVDQLQTSSQVADLCVTNPLMAGVGEFEEKDWQTKLDIKVTAANTVSAISGLSQDLLTMEDGTTAEFLQTDRYACIVSEDLLKEKNWSVGDVIPLNLYSYVHTNKYQVNFEPLQLTEYEIAGTMDRFVSTSGQSGRTPEIIIPFETVRELYHQKGIAFTADSASFYVADPLDLNEFKEEMQGYGLLSKAPDALYSYQGNTLLVRDSSFISTASKLRQGFDILTGFLPAVVLTVIFIGYIISILLTDSRQTEYALMRIQGMRAGLCFLTFFLEEFLIVLFGCVISGGFYKALYAGNLKELLAVSGLFMISYLTGSAAALLRLGKRSAMEVLFRED